MDVQGFFMRYLLLPLLVAIATLVLVLKNKNKTFITNKKLITGLLLLGLLLGLPGILGLLQLDYMPWGYIMSVLYGLMLGMATVYLLATRYYYELDNQKIYMVIVYLIGLALGTYIHQILFNHFAPYKMGFWAATSTFSFLIPLLFWWSYRALLAIPAEIYKVWQYPAVPLQLALEGLDFDRMLVLELEVFKVTSDAEPIRVKVKAPANMNFGDWFYKFIEDYNLKFPKSPVTFNDHDGTAFLWIFFVKNAFFKRHTFIDPELNIQENGITEKMTIYAKRVSKHVIKPVVNGDESIFI